MRRFPLSACSIFLSCFLLFCPYLVYAKIVVKDDLGFTVTLLKPAKRVISLAPSLTEILFAIGSGNSIVGVSSSSDFPKEAKKLPIVLNVSDINIESILSLRPDLIVSWNYGNPYGQIDKLQKMGISVYRSAPKGILDVVKTIRDLGVLTGNKSKSQQVATRFTKRYFALKEKFSDKKKIKVFYQVWDQPLFTIGKRSIINDVINFCGGQNVFVDTIGFAPQVNIEAVLVANPEVVIGGYDVPHWKRSWKKWPQLTAVKQNNLFSISPDLLQRYGPRLMEGASILCRDLEMARKRK